MSENLGSAADFFDEIGDQYDTAIKRCVPRYAEMLELMLDYVMIPPPKRILELGCGSGNLTHRIRKRYPDSHLTAIDASERMLEISRQRFESQTNLTFEKSEFQRLEFPADSFDLVVSSISIHHLNDAEKLKLFAAVRRWLDPNGVFTFCDQFSGETAELYAKHMHHWKEASFAMGATQDEWKDWMQHQEAHDFHSTLSTHVELLQQAGFQTVDCTRRYFLWTTLIAFE